MARTRNVKAEEAGEPSYGRHVPAVHQTVRILQHLASSPGQATLTDICTSVGIHLSKGLAILNTLRASGVVTRTDPAKTYSLGPTVLTFARAYLDRTSLAAAASPYLRRLADETSSTALLGVVGTDGVVIVAREEAPSGLAVTIRVGHRYPLTWGAHGKAIVAFSSPDRRDALLRSTQRFSDARPKPDPTAVAAELDEVRVRGFSADVGGMQAGVSAVSAPLLNAASEPAAVIILVGTFPAEQVSAHGTRTAAAAAEMNAHLAPFLSAGG